MAQTKQHPLVIALVGLSGSGKSTIAALVATQLGWVQVDTDALVVAQTGRTIAELFATHGEQYFRDLETGALADALASARATPTVIATGGGIVLRPANCDLLRTHAFVVWLDATTAALHARLQAHAERRPLLEAGDPYERLERLRGERREHYAAVADCVVVTDDLSAAAAAEQIIAAYQAWPAHADFAPGAG